MNVMLMATALLISVRSTYPTKTFDKVNHHAPFLYAVGRPSVVCLSPVVCTVVEVRGNAGEHRSWAPKNCWRGFPGPTQPLMVQTG